MLLLILVSVVCFLSGFFIGCLYVANRRIIDTVIEDAADFELKKKIADSKQMFDFTDIEKLN